MANQQSQRPTATTSDSSRSGFVTDDEYDHIDKLRDLPPSEDLLETRSIGSFYSEWIEESLSRPTIPSSGNRHGGILTEYPPETGSTGSYSEWIEESLNRPTIPSSGNQHGGISIPREILKRPFVQVLIENPPVFNLIHDHLGMHGVDYYFGDSASEGPRSPQNSRRPSWADYEDDDDDDEAPLLPHENPNSPNEADDLLDNYSSSDLDSLNDEDIDFDDITASILAVDDSEAPPIKLHFNTLKWDEGAGARDDSAWVSPRTRQE
ncbi:hypothetical protein AAE478_002885 [Parahypoxylon ruwenzoriense]